MHLDTHVAVWLYAGLVERFPHGLRDRLGTAAPLVSPMVRLELQFLHEIGRITVPASEVLADLEGRIDLRVAESALPRVAAIATTLSWTRDPFDRLIAAHALADDLPLVTKDRRLLRHCPVAIWNAPTAE